MKIKIRVDVEQCDIPIEGNFDSGDKAADRDLEVELRERLERGDQFAWFDAIVTATATVDGEAFIGRATLGGCSYASLEDFKQNSGYYEDLKNEAILDVKKSVIAASKRALAAVRVMLDFNEGKVEIEEE